MKDLIFIGGAKGIGKSTIIHKLKESLCIPVVNTGDIVLESRRNNLNPENEIEKYLCGNYTGIVDTHYTGSYANEKFPRGLSKEALLNIQKLKSIELILLETDEETLFQRRYENKPSKYHDRRVIQLELEYSRIYFQEYCKDLLIQGLIINNNKLNQSVLRILDFIK